MNTFFAAFLALSSTVVFGGTIYSNVATDTGSTLQFTANGYSAIGDQVTLAGTDRSVTQATTQFFNALPTAGTFNATLSLYSLGSNPAVLGALLGSYTMSNIAIGAFDVNNPLTSGTTTVTFSGLNVTVPNSLIFVFTVASVSKADIGLTLFDAPTVGSSNNALFISATGNTYAVTPADPGYGNINFSLAAATATNAPEPATFLMIGLSLGILALVRNRRTNRSVDYA